MTPAREEILDRVRRALAGVPAGETADDVPVPRGYRREAGASRERLLDRLADRLRDYGAGVHRVPAGEVPATVRRVCEARGSRRVAVPPDLPSGWLPPDIDTVPDRGLTADELDACDAALSGCRLAIAETGTLVLDGGPGQGRRLLSLVPDHHVCVLGAEQVVGLVPEAIAALREAAAEGRPITFVSGPSATSDIELSRVQGVHGPRQLDVIVVEATGRAGRHPEPAAGA
jgi:L-lactate dehydrogenase complex protein LldG